MFSLAGMNKKVKTEKDYKKYSYNLKKKIIKNEDEKDN